MAVGGAGVGLMEAATRASRRRLRVVGGGLLLRWLLHRLGLSLAEGGGGRRRVINGCFSSIGWEGEGKKKRGRLPAEEVNRWNGMNLFKVPASKEEAEKSSEQKV